MMTGLLIYIGGVVVLFIILFYLFKFGLFSDELDFGCRDGKPEYVTLKNLVYMFLASLTSWIGFGLVVLFAILFLIVLVVQKIDWDQELFKL